MTVKGIDDIEYVYDNLETLDYNIYGIVKSGDNLGSARTVRKIKRIFDFMKLNTYEIKFHYSLIILFTIFYSVDCLLRYLFSS